jgi:hypothetical protein
MPASERLVLSTDSPNTGRGKWNLTQSELVALANTLEQSSYEVWRGATAPATPHNYKTWIYIPPGYNGTSITAIWREWDGDSWQDMSVGPAGRGFFPRGAWASGTTYAVDDIVTDDGETFRRKVAGAGTTPPASDTTNWEKWAAKGATGGAHGSGHLTAGSDPVPLVTTSADGLARATDKSKLDGIESGATADMTATEIRTALLTVDGAGSGLDADLLDGQDITAIQLKDQKGLANGYMGLGAAGRADPDDLGSGITGSGDDARVLHGDGVFRVPAEAYSPPWVSQSGAGSIFAAWGSGDPEAAVRMLEGSGVDVQPNQVGTANARIVSFILPKQISVSAVRTWTVAALADSMFLAIYRASDGARIWYTPIGEDALDDAWVNTTQGTPFTLEANTRYWMCFGNNSTGSIIRYRMGPMHLGANFYGADNSAIVGVGGAVGIGVQAQIPVASGAFPATMPIIAAASWSVGGAPICFLVGTP